MRAERSSGALFTVGNEIPVVLSTGESRCSVPLPRCRTGLRGHGSMSDGEGCSLQKADQSRLRGMRTTLAM